MLEPAVFVFRNFTHPYVYFNPIAGGIHGARGNFELDYWGISAGEAADWMISSRIVKKVVDTPLVVATNFDYPIGINFSDYSNVKVEYIRYREIQFKYNNNYIYNSMISRQLKIQNAYILLFLFHLGQWI